MANSTAVDALLMYWLNGTHDEEMAEWWQTDEAHETAREVVDVVLNASAAGQECNTALAVTQRMLSGWAPRPDRCEWFRTNAGRDLSESMSTDEAAWIDRAWNAR